MTNGKPLQSFTAIGQVADERVYEFRMSDSFVPFRRDINYYPCREVKIADLLERLSFTQGSRYWGQRFRYGHFEISEEDFLLISSSMLCDMEALHGIRS